MNKKWTLWFVGILTLICLVISAVFFLFIQKTPEVPFANVFPQKNNPTGAGPLKKTLEETTIDYWLYGRIVEVISADADGLRAVFSFDGDPTATRIPVVILWMDGWYQLFVYEKDFEQPYQIQRPDLDGLRNEIANGRLVELHVQFLRNTTLKSDSDLMYQIEAASRGDWTQLPTREITVDAVGVVKN